MGGSDDWSSDDGEDRPSDLPKLPEMESKAPKAATPGPAAPAVVQPVSRTVIASTLVFASNSGQRFHAGLAVIFNESKSTFAALLYAQVGGQRKVFWTCPGGDFKCELKAYPSPAFTLTQGPQQIGVLQSSAPNARAEGFKWVVISTLLTALKGCAKPLLPGADVASRTVVAEVDYEGPSGKKRKKIKTKHAALVRYQAWRVDVSKLDAKVSFDLTEDSQQMPCLPPVPIIDSLESTPTSLGALLKGSKLNDQKLVVFTQTSPFAKYLLELCATSAQTQPSQGVSTHPAISKGDIGTLLQTDDPSHYMYIMLARPVNSSKAKKPKKSKAQVQNHIQTTPTAVTVSDSSALALSAGTNPEDTKQLDQSLESVRQHVKTLPRTQMKAVQHLLKNLLKSFKEGMAGAEPKPETAEEAAKLAVESLKNSLRSFDQDYQNANLNPNLKGSIGAIVSSFSSLEENLTTLRKNGGFDSKLRKSYESQIASLTSSLQQAEMREKVEQKREGEMEQVKRDYTEALKAGLAAEDKIKELKEKLEEAVQMRQVFESGVTSMKKALEDEMLKRRRLEKQVDVLEAVYEVGVPRMWGSDVKKILTMCDQKVGKDPVAQLRELIDNPKIEDDNNEDFD
ncbi:hypothetical protein AAMO2058_001265500 [Amorphochlora amoebiformis]